MIETEATLPLTLMALRKPEPIQTSFGDKEMWIDAPGSNIAYFGCAIFIYIPDAVKTWIHRLFLQWLRHASPIEVFQQGSESEYKILLIMPLSSVSGNISVSM